VDVDFPDDDTAWDEAAAVCSDMFCDIVKRFGDSSEWRLEVAYKSGTVRHLFPDRSIRRAASVSGLFHYQTARVMSLVGTNAKCRPHRATAVFGGKAENITRDEYFAFSPLTDIGNRSTTGLILFLVCPSKSLQTSVIRG
jgi:hypothetical protein